MNNQAPKKRKDPLQLHREMHQKYLKEMAQMAGLTKEQIEHHTPALRVPHTSHRKDVKEVVMAPQ